MLLPFAEHSATLHATSCFHLEDIGKIRAKRQLQEETNLFASIVGNVEVFMNTIFNSTFDSQADCICLKITALRTDLWVCEVETRSVESELTGIDQHPGFPVDEETIVTDEARVDRRDPLVATRVDLALLIGDHEGTSLADSDARWRDFNLDGHMYLSPFMPSLR